MKFSYVPAALALHQRPGVPGIRSTFGTGTELFEQSAPDVLPPGEPPLPERPLHPADAERCRRAADLLPGVRRARPCAVGRGTGLQQPGRLPHL